MSLPSNLFSVDFYDLKTMSFIFGDDIFIIFEMPGSSYQRPVGKINISLLFRPSVIRGPCSRQGPLTRENTGEGAVGNGSIQVCQLVDDVK